MLIYEFNYHELAFIITFAGNNKFLNINYLKSIFANYETPLSIWGVTNEFNEKVHIQFWNSRNVNKAYVDWDATEIEVNIDQGDLSFLIDVTERYIHLTDDLITEFYNFFNEFPDAVKDKIDLKLIINYRFIIAFDMKK